jgi:hypothetical protein
MSSASEDSSWRESPAEEQIRFNNGLGAVGRDPLYLFMCHLQWHREGDLKAYQELVAALDDADDCVRAVAENLLRRRSPRPPEQGEMTKGESRSHVCIHGRKSETEISSS